MDKFEEKKKRIDERIEKNLLKKKLLLAKEKKRRAIKFSDIGRIAFKANIDFLDEDILLGAFLEIAMNSNESNFSKWKTLASEFSSSKSSNQIYSINFLEEPESSIKQKLKENKFSWNRFRKEYYGKGDKIGIEKMLQGCKFTLEEICQ
ncbi:Putative conjugative transfer protein TraD (plasmid) [Candidatus Protochlamydia naegleriophila]|uniref:Putative conjugative transfer protein TraD n=1 Tax=Candidatus Protochlamydia naegleriophila TaxID=389348 RepID=A0A0U5EUW7_9BACT|nr:hypothetical protein [Candidatus Protochlamydia naegleriophila]CUI18067.1 Putative conjugative transfer protein TraD [Candidatus Protochlamydia naegleriophila]